MQYETVSYGLGREMKSLETAIFSSKSLANIWGFPKCIVHFRRMDDFGNICFSVAKRYENMDSFETIFPARLRFYNKAFAYVIEISGTAVTESTLSGIEVVFKISTQRIARYRANSFLSRFKLCSNLLSQTVARLTLSGWPMARNRMLRIAGR